MEWDKKFCGLNFLLVLFCSYIVWIELMSPKMGSLLEKELLTPPPLFKMEQNDFS